MSYSIFIGLIGFMNLLVITLSQIWKPAPGAVSADTHLELCDESDGGLEDGTKSCMKEARRNF